jgi:hypothetical protein
VTAASSLVDTFTVKDTNLWTWSGTADVASGRLVLIPTSGYTDKVESVATYNLVGSSLTVELVTAPLGAGGIDVYFTAFIGADEARFVTEAGVMTMREIAGASNTATNVTYDPVAHRWLRLRHDATTIFWETSPNGTTWTTQRSKSPGRTWDTIQVRLWTGFFGTEPTPGQTVFDNLNLTPDAAADMVVRTGPGRLAPGGRWNPFPFDTTPSAAVSNADATLTGTATITPTAASDKPANAALTGTATISPAAASTKPVDSALTGTATITPVADRLAQAAATLTATATATGAATSTKPVDAALTATATVTPAAASTKPVDASLTATATATPAAASTKPVDAALAATATITAAMSATKPATATLTATATITAAATVGAAPISIDAAPTFTATITPAADRLAQAAATLTGTATLAGTANATKPAQAALTAAAAITAAAAAAKDVAAALTTTATITAAMETVGSLTVRPNSGTTARPGTGQTIRPVTTATLRP